MTISGLCATCDRTVYLSKERDRHCPVCSTPLVGVDEDDQGIPASA